MATIGNYGVYEALLQTPVEGPEFADVGDGQDQRAVGDLYFFEENGFKLPLSL